MTAEGQSVSQAFRLAMRNVASPVAVISTLVDGHPYGTTVSAFMSLSMDPPLLTFALDRGSRLLAEIRPRSVVGIDVLGRDHADIALHFAGKSADKFHGVDWRLDDQAPALEGSHARITAEIEQRLPAGDHTLVLASVRTAHANPGAPLTYWQRAFGTVTRP